ncbi:hypothetical protein [Pyxidicoccus caerfyrddinensis]|uniref:hypothetical protein n=1 Tax=Pyxidicoccus caerfyrddinensis TaxID=2709663 RepID=UPI0013DCFECB|nr:hypothetical protein [Pyxidicoccus caerfyrddinensis]
MNDTQMTRALRELVSRHEPRNSEQLLDEAVQAAWRQPPSRAGGPPPGELMADFRERLQGERVTFHRRLPVRPYDGADVPASPGCSLWRVDIPLTLFPKRDHGFSRVECIIDFRAGDDSWDAFRVVKLLPEERSQVMAKAELGGELQFDASARVGLSLPVPPMALAEQVGARLYAKGQVGPFVYEATRACVEAEIVAGTGGRWRLDDTSAPQRVGAESHQLAAILEVREGAPRIDAAGYLQAYSDVHWLTQTLGSFWLNLKAALRDFFRSGPPSSSASSRCRWSSSG